MPNTNNLQHHLKLFLEHKIVTHTILTLVIINAIILGMETSVGIMNVIGKFLIIIDGIILSIFVLEIVARLFVYRWKFWKDPWSVFDFTVVAIALIPASGPFAVMRALRVLRVLRLLTIVPSMRRVVGALLAAIPGLGSIALVLMIIYYVFAVIATNLFAEAYPEWFGTLGHSFYTLFQIMTLESWSMGISRPVMEQFPYAWVFFIPFILVATFTMLNLFIAIIVNAMHNYSESEHQETREALKRSQHQSDIELHEHFNQMHNEIVEMRCMLTKLIQEQNSSQNK